MSNGSFTSSGGLSSSMRNGVMHLQGPASTRLEINGVSTTYGQVVAWAAGRPTTTAAEPAPKQYRLAPDTKISTIETSSSDVVQVAAAFASDSLRVNLQGEGDVYLPNKTFEQLAVSHAGKGDVVGDGTEARHLTCSLRGTGDIRDILALGIATLSLLGTGDISIKAVDRRLVTQSTLGMGDIRVTQGRAATRATSKTLSAATVSALAATMSGLAAAARAAAAATAPVGERDRSTSPSLASVVGKRARADEKSRRPPSARRAASSEQ